MNGQHVSLRKRIRFDKLDTGGSPLICKFGASVWKTLQHIWLLNYNLKAEQEKFVTLDQILSQNLRSNHIIENDPQYLNHEIL